MSTIVRSPLAIIGSSPKEIYSRTRANVPGPGHYDFQRPIVSVIILVEAGKLFRLQNDEIQY